MRKAIWLARTMRTCIRDGRKLRSFDMRPDEAPALGLHRLVARLSPEEMLRSYQTGFFPLADLPDPRFVQLVNPPARAIIPIDAFDPPSRLLRTVRNAPYEVRFDSDILGLVALCGEIADNRPETWLSAPLQRLYLALSQRGVAHSVEIWDNDVLVGGAFGIAVGGAFCGESMVSRVRDGSKIALVHLVRRLEAGGFDFIDCQYMSPHLRQFGAIEISRADYERRLANALAMPAQFDAQPRDDVKQPADALPLTPSADISAAPGLLAARSAPGRLIADKGYDANGLRRTLEAQQTEAVIPSTRSRKRPILNDRHAYRRRKDSRRIATRYDKLARNVLAAVKIAAVILWWTE